MQVLNISERLLADWVGCATRGHAIENGLSGRILLANESYVKSFELIGHENGIVANPRYIHYPSLQLLRDKLRDFDSLVV